MKASDLLAHFQSLDTGWVKWDQTVDSFKSGRPEVDIQGIAVGWMSYTWALQRAVELGCNIFVTHEPTYYDHLDQNERIFALPGVKEKRQFIEENNLTILRCHDLWDQMPRIGIPDSWGDLLELGPSIAGAGYFRVYEGGGKTALQLARQIAARTRSFGQEAVQLIGPQDRLVTRIAIGTGAITPFLKLIPQYKIDLAICTDDGFTYWRDGAYALDMGLPVIVVHHAVSEEAGLLNLANHLASAFPEIPVHHIPQKCMFHLITA